MHTMARSLLAGVGLYFHWIFSGVWIPISRCRAVFHLIFPGLWVSSVPGSWLSCCWQQERSSSSAQPGITSLGTPGCPSGEEPLPGCSRVITPRGSHRDHQMAFLNPQQAVLSSALLPRGKDSQQGCEGAVPSVCNILYSHEETEAVTYGSPCFSKRGINDIYYGNKMQSQFFKGRKRIKMILA